MKPVYKVLMADRNRHDPEKYDSFEIILDDSGFVHFKLNNPIYPLLTHCTPKQMANTLRWMADEIESIGDKNE